MDSAMEFSWVAKFADKVTAPLRQDVKMSDKSGKQLTALRSELTRLGAERTAITQFKKLNAT